MHGYPEGIRCALVMARTPLAMATRSLAFVLLLLLLLFAVSPSGAQSERAVLESLTVPEHSAEHRARAHASSSDASDDLVCVNGGVREGDHCVCPMYYTGADCHERQCPNSIGGVGPYSILPVNPKTMLCDYCDTSAFRGLGCQLCQNDAACRRYGKANARCNRDIVVRGDNKQLECGLNSPFFLKLMGDGDRNITAQIILNCSTEDGSAFGSHDNGFCSMAIYRVEPNNEYVDPFFRCAASQCSMTMSKVEGRSEQEDEETALRKFFLIVRVSGQVILVGLCALLATLGVFANNLGYRRMRRATLTLTTTITVTVLLYIFLMVISMRSVNPEMAVEYECKRTSCGCAEDPPSRYPPICSESSILVDQIFPAVKNSIRFVCSTTTNLCRLTLTDLTLVFEADCAGSECVVEDDFPLTPSNDNALPAKHVKNVVTTLFVLALFTCAGVLAHYLWLQFRTESRNKEFDLLFQLASGRAGSDVIFTGLPAEDGEEEAEAEVAETVAVESGRSSSTIRASAARVSLSLGGGEGRNMSAPRLDDLYVMDSPVPQPPNVEDAQLDDVDERVRLLPAIPSSATMEDGAGGDRSSAVSVRESAIRRAAHLTAAELSEILRVRQLTCSPLTLTVTDLQYVLSRAGRTDCDMPRSERIILHRINFSVHSGEVLAIMGPSGAGKTTLLDLLSARAKSGDVTGSIRLNGTAISTIGRCGQQYRNIIGYVSQEDTLLPALTVRQTIEYAARLKLPAAFSARTIRRIVHRMILLMKLQRCEHTLIGDGAGLRGISGGEKRRVSIAVELLANPRILFLDEPTSGLDTVSAKRVLEAVVELAKDSTMRCYAPYYFSFKPMVIFSIHQPSQEIYELFDKILLLSRGMSVYCGPAQSASSTLETRLLRSFGPTRTVLRKESHSNPAEYLMKLEESLDDHVRAELLVEDTRDNINRAALSQRYNGSDASADLFGDVVQPADGSALLLATAGFRRYYANVYQQVGLLISRSGTCIITSFNLVACHAGVVACLATLMCLLYRQQELDLPGALNRAGSVTFLLLVTSFVSLSCLEQLILERKLFIVERENGFYSTFPYLISKVFVDIIPLRVIPAVVLASVIYFPMGFRIDDGSHFFWFIVVIVLFSVCVTLMILCIGIVAGTFGSAALLSSVCILWIFVFGGSMVQAETIPPALKPFKSTSPFFLAFESLMVNELNGQNCVFSPTDETGRQSSASIPILCVQYLANVGLKPERFGIDVMQLALYCFLLLVIAWALLVLCTRLVR